MRTALLLVDVQYDFLPGGALAVPDGDAILPVILNVLRSARSEWHLVIASQDFHPPGHVSFASSHHEPDAAPFSRKRIRPSPDEEEEEITLWPDHCVQGTKGTRIESGVLGALIETPSFVLVRKGFDESREEYSAFGGIVASGSQATRARRPSSRAEEEDRLQALLEREGIERVVVCGLATDYCVRASVLDAVRLIKTLKEVVVLKDAVRGIDDQACGSFLDKECQEKGVRVSDSSEWLS